MVLINIGVHKLESYKNNQGFFENSYFVHRPIQIMLFFPLTAPKFFMIISNPKEECKQIFTNVVKLIMGRQKFGISLVPQSY